jgi:branched-chain amino acid transport system permease protein
MYDPSTLLQFLISGIGIGCVYGLIGIGFSVIYNASGIVNFAQGAFVMLGGMGTHLLSTKLGLPLPAAVPLTVAAVAVAGLAVERIVVRPLWNRQATLFVMILATLAAQIVIEHATLLLAGDQPKTLPAFTGGPPIRILGAAVSLQMVWIIGSSLVLVGALALFFKRTIIGKAMRACAVNREAAALLGIPVSRLLSYAFAISAALGAIAGILITPTQYTAFNVGVPFAISGFIAAILGGFGSAFGAFLGGLLLGVMQSGAIVLFGAGYKNVAALSVLLVFLLIRPSGLVGSAKA